MLFTFPQGSRSRKLNFCRAAEVLMHQTELVWCLDACLGEEEEDFCIDSEVCCKGAHPLVALVAGKG